ncbi:hypothetical protein ACHAXS_005809 [Conticribra weissflogii]
MTLAKSKPLHSCGGRPVLFLDIDGVLNYVKHSPQIHLEKELVSRLKTILEETNALIVLSTFWRHFHEYISYVFHRHGIDAARFMLEMPMGITPGKQSTKTFLKFHRERMRQNQVAGAGERAVEDVQQFSDSRGICENAEEANNSMIGRFAEDEGEYCCRAEEIEAWLRMYGQRYLGAQDNETCVENSSESIENEGCNSCEYIIQHHQSSGKSKSNKRDNDLYTTTDFHFHPENWKYVIIDDRPTAAKPGTPLFERFILTNAEIGLTDENVKSAIRMLLHGPNVEKTNRNEID